MPDVRKSRPKTFIELTAEWDNLATERERQLTSGLDISFANVVAPAAVQLLAGADLSLLLDVGSGTGHFSALMSPHAGAVVGIEPAGNSVSIAKRLCAGKENVRFIQAAIEDVPRLSSAATSAVAVMVMMAAPDLSLFAKSVRGLIAKGACFVAVVPHPCFWPMYWGYSNADWFDYGKETLIEAPFEISNERTKVWTSHIHRPLSQYLTTFSEHGFRLDAVLEPMPSKTIQAMYPRPWEFPRFAAFRWFAE